MLRELHWLPVKHQIKFKLLVLTFKALNSQGLAYLQDCLPQYTPRRALCSGDKNLLVIPGLRDSLLSPARAFCALAPTCWNSLPDDIWICCLFAVHVRQRYSIKHLVEDNNGYMVWHSSPPLLIC